MDIEIESGIDIPEMAGTKYPLEKLKVKESFFLSDSELPKSGREGIGAAVYAFAKRRGWKFTVRKAEKQVKGKAVKGVRVWRTA